MSYPADEVPRAVAPLLLLTVALSLASCGEPPPPAAFQVEDSAGVRIVTTTGSVGAESGWRVSRRPLYRTGWRDGEPTFELLRSGVVRADGSSVVADANGNTIYTFSSTGDLLHELGGPGQGPGEFEHLDGVVIGAADTVFGQDGWVGGLSSFAGGQLLADRRLEWGWRVGLTSMEIAARARDGSLLLRPGPYSPIPSAPSWEPAPVLRVSPDLSRVDTLVMVDHFQRRPQEDRNPIRYYGHTAISPTAIVYSRSDRAEIRWYDIEGSLTQISRWDHPMKDVTDADWDVYERWTRSRGGRELNEERMNRMLADQKASLRGTVPVSRRLLLDASGNAWLAEYQFDADMSRFHIVTPDGRWLGSIELPEGALVLAVGEGHVLAVEQDEWDIQAVVVYELIKG